MCFILSRWRISFFFPALCCVASSQEVYTYFYLNMDEQSLCGQVLKLVGFSAARQRWFLFKVRQVWHFTWGSLRKLARASVHKNKRVFCFSPFCISSAGSGGVVWLSSPWKSHCALELSYYDSQTVFRLHSKQPKVKPWINSETASLLFWLQPSLKATWNLPLNSVRCVCFPDRFPFPYS